MAITIDRPILDGPAGNVRVIITTIDFDSSYPTGGEPLDLEVLGVLSVYTIHVGSKAGYTFEWNGDKTAPKILAYRQTATTGPLAQVANATDLSAATNIPVTVYCQS